MRYFGSIPLRHPDDNVGKEAGERSESDASNVDLSYSRYSEFPRGKQAPWLMNLLSAHATNFQ